MSEKSFRSSHVLKHWFVFVICSEQSLKLSPRYPCAIVGVCEVLCFILGGGADMHTLTAVLWFVAGLH